MCDASCILATGLKILPKPANGSASTEEQCNIITLVPAKEVGGSPDLKCHHAVVLPHGFYVFQ